MKANTVSGVVLGATLWDVQLICKQVETAGFRLVLAHITKLAAFSDALRDESFEIILSDHNLPEIDVFQALQLRNEICPEVPFICVSQSISEEFSIDLLRQGATDVVLKNRLGLLPFAVKRALNELRHKQNTLSYKQIKAQATALQQEVTEQKKTVQALKESNARLQKVLEVENVGVMFWDLETGNLTDANDAFLNMMGYERADIATHSLTWQKFTPDEYHDITLAEIEKFKRVGRIGPYEKEYYCKDGSRKWLLFAGSSLGGNASAEFCVDISERKHMETQLKEQQELIAGMGKMAKIGGWEFDVISGKGIWTEETARIHDTDTADEPNVAKGISFYKQESRKKIEEAIKKAIEKGEEYNLELELVSARGVEKWVQTIGYPVIENGKVIKIRGSFQDVTEKHKQNELLIQKEEQLREYFEGDITGDYIATAEGIVVSCNPAFVGILGYDTTEEIIGRNIAEVYQNPDDRKDFLSLVQLQKTLKNYKSKLKRKDGQNIIGNENIVGKFDVDGKLTRYYGYLYDVTDQLRAEEELVKKNQMLSSVMQTQQELIVRYLPDTTLVFVNKAYSKFFGIGEDELIGQKFLQFVPESEWPLELSRIAQLNRQIPSNTSISQAVKSDGTKVTLQWTDTAIFNEWNEVTEIQSFGIDITEKLGAEKVLNLFKSAIEASSVAVIITNAKSEISYTNPFFSHLTGYSYEEVIGNNLSLLKSGHQPETIYEEMWQTISGGDTWEGELLNKKKNGDLFWVRTFISPIINSRGKVSDFVAIQEDITFKKQAEEDKRKLDIAQKTARFKQDFLAKMSHEIRTPLAGVLGMIDVLEQTRLGEDQLDYVNDIKVSGGNLKEIINQVLEYSKIEAGKVHLKPIAFKFKSLLEDARVLYKDSMSAGVEFGLEIDSRIPPLVKADKFRLSQVINNFVSNAIKFTQQGSISIIARLEENANEDEHMVIKIEVCDTGKGMPESLQKKLFNPFVQSEEGERHEYEGTGLGLSICKELAELMHGEIGVLSEEGKGSTFWFSFTAETAKEFLPSQTQKPISLGTKKLRVLLVEDTLVLQKITKLLLNSMGHEVQLANHGQHALEVFKPSLFDLILMDINMPIMDGVSAFNILKETYINLPPIVGLSANAFEGDREKYLALGMDDYLTKPFNNLDFEKLLPRILK